MMADDFSKRPMAARLERLLQYLESDPGNLTLLTDAAETAISEGRGDIAHDILDKQAQRSPLPANLRGLLGVAAMQENAFDEAALVFEDLLQSSPGDPSIRFNLAWSWAMSKNFPGAMALLNDETTAALPQAAMLHVQLLHDQGKFEEAAEQAKIHLKQHPDYPGLLGAVSVLAMDIEDVTLAKECAQRAGDNPDALTTLGTLALGDQDPRAFELFTAALKKNPHAPRAWVGKGLAEMASGKNAEAARDILHGAELFKEHVGSWIAAGWAQLLTRDISSSRSSFEKALALDHNFAESHGSLAVISILEGRMDDARKQAETALRLDSKSFSGVLAQSMLLQSKGEDEAARALIERALHTPIDASGTTIAKAIAKHGLSF
jgi:tetratricopeptide (TPR) repeat protein